MEDENFPISLNLPNSSSNFDAGTDDTTQDTVQYGTSPMETENCMLCQPGSSSSRSLTDARQTVDINPAWDFLPDVALIRIFSKLGDNDRRRAGSVCRKFNQIFHYPTLWRTRCYDVGKPWCDQALTGFAEQHGAYVRNLRIVSSRPSFNSSKRVQRSLDKAFCSLLRYNAQLKRFSMEKLQLNRFWYHENTKQKLYQSVRKFLQSQRQLRRLDLHGIQFSFANGLLIMETIARTTGHSVAYLNIQDLFLRGPQSIQDNSRFIRLTSQFKHLSWFYCNYSCLNDEILETIFDNNGSRLKTLSVKVHKQEPHNHIIPPYIWRRIRKKYPNARVNFEFDQIGSATKIIPILAGGMQLRILHIWSGYDMEGERLLSELFTHITRYFKDSLEVVVIELDNDEVSFDRSFLLFVQECKKMRSLEINGTFEPKTVKDICDLHKEKKIHLLRFHTTCCNLSESQWIELVYIRETYQAMIDEQELDWHITTDLLFTM